MCPSPRRETTAAEKRPRATASLRGTRGRGCWIYRDTRAATLVDRVRDDIPRPIRELACQPVALEGHLAQLEVLLAVVLSEHALQTLLEERTEGRTFAGRNLLCALE